MRLQSNRLQGGKLQTHLKDVFKESVPVGALLTRECLRAAFPGFSCLGTPEASVAVIQGSPATAQAGGRTWHCLYRASFLGVENERVMGSWKFSCKIPEKGLCGQAMCSYAIEEVWKAMHGAMEIKPKLQWRPYDAVDARNTGFLRNTTQIKRPCALQAS